jgi:hypothetical protein
MICASCQTDGIKTVAELKSHSCKTREEWAKLIALRKEGKEDAADRLTKKLLGVKGPEMPEEIREQLREYAKAHRKEHYARKKQKRLERRLAKRRLQAAPTLRRA